MKIFKKIPYAYDNGLAEGSVNEIKRIKHTMCGKASFATLRADTLIFARFVYSRVCRGFYVEIFN